MLKRDQPITLQTGHARLMGATLEQGCINFALAAPNATAVELCLFDADGKTETARLPLPAQTHGIWHGALPDSPQHAREGLLYGWRVHGPWAPAQGHRFNPAKLLLDPYARQVFGNYDGSDIHLGHEPQDPSACTRDPRDNAAQALKAVVVADLAATSGAPAVPPGQRVLYELHVKGFSALNEKIPAALRGTYAGLAHPASIDYLRSLGITTLSLMPVAFRADEARLQHMGLSNYWGYSPIAWSAPENRYASHTQAGGVRAEFRAMVDALHQAGLEVVLDVVYNHSAELDQWGPTLSLRGIDNALYYQLSPHERSAYENWTGCGNALNLNQPFVLRMVMDSLRLWVTDYGIDGFRFDLATTLARGDAAQGGNYQAFAPLFAAVAQDPLLRNRLLIAEPWDIGPGGYQLGQFAPGWLEWNDKFRDNLRAFWLHGQGTLGEFAIRIAGSSDCFAAPLRGAPSSVNMITAHDGFTLRDLVSYNERHNQANGEDNRDGHAHNWSINNGVEGPSDDAQVLSARQRQSKALLASLLLSLGTPMLLAGDELGHSQQGNNNAYCQDNALSWLHWDCADHALLRFVQQLLQLRRSIPLLQSHAWWQNADAETGPWASWLRPDGQLMQEHDWNQQGVPALALLLRGTDSAAVAMLWNRGADAAEFTLPQANWQLRLRSDIDNGFALDTAQTTSIASSVLLSRCSVCLATTDNMPSH